MAEMPLCIENGQPLRYFLDFFNKKAKGIVVNSCSFVDFASLTCVAVYYILLLLETIVMSAKVVAVSAMNPSCFMCFALLFLCFSLKINLSSGADTISANQSLSGDDTILSKGGVFRLGFFKPGNSSNNYIGMWYDKVSERTIVWVANRERPISDRYKSELKILNGNLVLFNESQTQVWSTNLNSSTSGSVKAVLNDTGNLVLSDGSNSSNPLWQSFDHPTHTWLPGSKIGLDKRTKTNQRLISWKNSEDPAPGLFSLELDPNGTSQYFILWNESETYWTSGVWNGQIFSLVPEMRLNYIYNFSYVTNENESYFIYSVYDTSIISRFVMDVTGQIKQLSWLEPSQQWNLFWSQPRQQCEVYAYCGAFGSCTEQIDTACDCLTGFQAKSESDRKLKDYSGGCGRKTPLQCESNDTANGERDEFLKSPGVKLPKHEQSVEAGSDKECKSRCLSNCSCTAYAYNSKGCSIWIGDLLSLQQFAADSGTGDTLYIKLAASDIPSTSNNTGMLIGIVAGSVAAVIVLLGLVLFYILRRRSAGVTKAVEGSLISFAYRDLQNATKNFSEKLGGGGFGSVFKGVLSDSTVIAAKRLESISQGEKQFRSEVSTIGTIQHVNLVRLRGFCSEGTKKLLVYDYMPNGSLNAILFHEKDSKVVDWKTRYQIALGTARGLVYLHEKCRDCIIHCDIKPENILLDADFVPKVADFGLAKLVGREFSRVLTTMRGTRGYLAPEWISGVPITAKADVYSYGMMLFEIVSGRRNTEQSEDGAIKFFPTYAANKIIGGDDILILLEPRLEGNADIEEVTRVCRVACWCIQDDETHRPSMSQVVQMLEGVMDVKLPPMPRSLQVFVESHDHIVFFTESSSSQTSQPQTNSSADSSQVKSINSATSSKS